MYLIYPDVCPFFSQISHSQEAAYECMCELDMTLRGQRDLGHMKLLVYLMGMRPGPNFPRFCCTISRFRDAAHKHMDDLAMTLRLTSGSRNCLYIP